MSIELLDLTSIKVAPDRQRKIFDPIRLLQLETEIANPVVGLLNPIAVERMADGTYLLQAGERRLRAVSSLADSGRATIFCGQPLQLGKIPATILNTNRPELDTLQRLLIEFSENKFREPLTWQEEAQATARIAELQTKLAETTGEAKPSISAIAANAQPASMPLETARKVTSAELLVARHLSNPEVRAAPDLKTATKIIQSQAKAETFAKLAVAQNAIPASSRHNIIHGDLRSELAKLPDNSIDVILTDPPYGINIAMRTDAKVERVGYSHAYDDTPEYSNELIEVIAREGRRLTDSRAHLWMFCAIQRFNVVAEILRSYGWNVHATPYIWHHPGQGSISHVTYCPRRSYEAIIHARRRDSVLNFTGDDVIQCSLAAQEAVDNAARKPVGLLTELLRRSAKPGSRVLDPCAGTGNLLLAGHAAGCNLTLVEPNELYFGVLKSRLMELEDV